MIAAVFDGGPNHGQTIQVEPDANVIEIAAPDPGAPAARRSAFGIIPLFEVTMRRGTYVRMQDVSGVVRFVWEGWQ